MRTIPPGFLDGEVTDLQICWMVTKAKTGEVIRGTEYDEDIEITTGTYAGIYYANAGITGSDVKSSSDLAVDNLEVKGALTDPTTADTGTGGSSPGDITIVDLNAADIEAGEYDNAEVATFLVNAEDPDLYQHVLRCGWTGNVSRTAEGEYRTEVRGLTQALSQGIVKTYSVGCQWELGSTPTSNPPGLCRVDMTPYTHTRAVTQVFSRRSFQIATPLIPMFGNVPGGKVTFSSGLNMGYSMEVKSYSSLVIGLYLPMPKDIEVGDTVIIKQGCDKAWMTCVNAYNNIDNFGGWGVLVPGEMEILRVGKR